jgi:hypothetical protein
MVLNQGRACGSGDTRKLVEYGEHLPLAWRVSKHSTYSIKAKRSSDVFGSVSALIFGVSEAVLFSCKCWNVGLWWRLSCV